MANKESARFAQTAWCGLMGSVRRNSESPRENKRKPPLSASRFISSSRFDERKAQKCSKNHQLSLAAAWEGQIPLATFLSTVSKSHLINFLDLGACATTTSRRTLFFVHATGHTAAGPLVHLRNDGIAQVLQLLHLVLELVDFGQLVGIEPLDRLVDCIFDLLLVGRRQLRRDLVVLHRVPHVVCVILQCVLGLDLLLVLLILRLPSLVVGDGDLVLLPGGLDAVGVDVEAHGDLRHAPGSRGDAGELEFAEQVVVSGPGPLPLVDLDKDSGLVVRVGGEDLLLLGWDGCVSLNQHSHDSPRRLEPERERSDVQQEEVLYLLVALATQDGSLDCSAVGDGLVGVDALAQLLAVEEVLQQLLHPRDSCGSTDEDHVMDGALVHLRIPQTLFHGFHALPEEIHVQLLESGSRDGGVEIDALEEGVDLNRGLGGGRQSPLRPLAGCPQPPQSPWIPTYILLMFPLEFLDEMVHHAIVEVFSSEMGVSRGSFHLKDPLFDGKEGDVERAAAKVEDEDVLLPGTARLLVEAVGDSSSSGLIDDAHDVKARDDAGILGGLALRVVEVSGDSNHGVLDGITKVSLGDLAHLGQHHGRDLFRSELLLLTLVLDDNHRLVRGACNDLEGPVLDVTLNRGIIEPPSNQTFCI
ncbi:NAD-specific glutamate dehydrogenase [Musa troglodytarum]|uniref:NAD-specific glutamate dehydrogenase n=1 Tax=Musa troglodytarum TaxID=320322 RepID=A0A9E7L7H4_9LILI|nr:NAD-specific glutamate dehydrogenase [Musa troglodytarum]